MKFKLDAGFVKNDLGFAEEVAGFVKIICGARAQEMQNPQVVLRWRLR